MATRYLYLVRHGNYNAYEQVDDDLGGSLTPLGYKQSEYTGDYLQNLPIDTLYTSTLRRAAQTTEVLSKYMPAVPVVPRRDLWEAMPVVPFRLEGSFHQKYPSMNPARLAEQNAYAEQAFSSLFTFVDEDSDAEVHDVLVCHGNLIRYMVCRTLGVDPRAWANMLIYQASISRVRIDDEEGIMLLSFNESMHMPEEILVD